MMTHRTFNCFICTSLTLLLFFFSPVPTTAEPLVQNPQGISGSLLLCGGGNLTESIHEAFRKSSKLENRSLVVIPSASKKFDEEKIKSYWQDKGFKQVEVLHVESKEQANQEKLVKVLTQASHVWIGGGQQSRLANLYQGTLVEKELLKVLTRGGIIGGTSAGAAIQCQTMIHGGKSEPKMSTGFNLLPDAIIDQHFTERNRIHRLRLAVEKNKTKVGIGIDEQTALWVVGRRIQVLGKGTATVILPASNKRKSLEFKAKASEVIDWTALRRASRVRSKKIAFPSQEMANPQLKNGTLIIVGGGGVPRSAVHRFIKEAGGPDSSIIVIPTAAGGPIRTGSYDTKMFQNAGAKNVHVIDVRKPGDADSPEVLKRLKEAKGIWFGGGRQWRLVDTYLGTQAEKLLHKVLERGGVIGGSSAGASIQAEYMVRGNPLGNWDMMAEGYEQGLGFLRGAAVDQHFTQRRRLKDLKTVIERFPQILGIGIDESTAIVVQGSIAEVVGSHKTFFLDKKNPNATYPLGLKSGERYDLVKRVKVD